QTHLYPQDPLDELRCAYVLGFSSAQALREKLEEVRNAVALLFGQLIAEPQAQQNVQEDVELQQVWQGVLDAERAQQILEARGFKNAQSLLDVLKRYREGRQFLMLDRTSRQRMDLFMPRLLQRLQQEAN